MLLFRVVKTIVIKSVILNAAKLRLKKHKNMISVNEISICCGMLE